MYDILLARFADEPAIVSPAHQKAFEGCLSGLASSEHIGVLLNARAAASDDEFWFAPDDWRSSYRPYRVKAGILHIPVKGVLLSQFPWQIGSWATGYQYIWKAFERGLADPEVKGIALVCHTPGGEVAENFDLVDRMFARRDEKPIRGFAHEYSYSAGYSILSLAPVITLSRTGGVGSIGVVTSHVDVSKMMDEIGWKVTFISAPEDGHKVDGNPYEALKPETRARIQDRINGLYDIFVATVARNRAMSEADVRATKALCFSAPDAIKLKLADAVGPFEDSMTAFAVEMNTPDSNEGDEEMADVKREDHERMVAEARSEGLAAGKAEGMAAGLKTGVSAERERITAIIGSDEGKERPKAALSAALKTDMTVDQAKGFLGDLPKEKAETQADNQPTGDNKQKFDAAMNQDKPDLGAGTGDKAEDQNPSELAKAYGLAGFS